MIITGAVNTANTVLTRLFQTTLHPATPADRDDQIDAQRTGTSAANTPFVVRTSGVTTNPRTWVQTAIDFPTFTFDFAVWGYGGGQVAPHRSDHTYAYPSGPQIPIPFAGFTNFYAVRLDASNSNRYTVKGLTPGAIPTPLQAQLTGGVSMSFAGWNAYTPANGTVSGAMTANYGRALVTVEDYDGDGFDDVMQRGPNGTGPTTLVAGTAGGTWTLQDVTQGDPATPGATQFAATARNGDLFVHRSSDNTNYQITAVGGVTPLYNARFGYNSGTFGIFALVDTGAGTRALTWIAFQAAIQSGTPVVALAGLVPLTDANFFALTGYDKVTLSLAVVPNNNFNWKGDGGWVAFGVSGGTSVTRARVQNNLDGSISATAADIESFTLAYAFNDLTNVNYSGSAYTAAIVARTGTPELRATTVENPAGLPTVVSFAGAVGEGFSRVYTSWGFGFATPHMVWRSNKTGENNRAYAAALGTTMVAGASVSLTPAAPEENFGVANVGKRIYVCDTPNTALTAPTIRRVADYTMSIARTDLLFTCINIHDVVPAGRLGVIHASLGGDTLTHQRNPDNFMVILNAESVAPDECKINTDNITCDSGFVHHDTARLFLKCGTAIYVKEAAGATGWVADCLTDTPRNPTAPGSGFVQLTNLVPPGGATIKPVLRF